MNMYTVIRLFYRIMLSERRTPLGKLHA